MPGATGAGGWYEIGMAISYNDNEASGLSHRWPHLNTTAFEERAMSEANSTVQYRDIPGFPGYRVGDDGSVWTAWKAKGSGYEGGFQPIIGSSWRRMKCKKDHNGHFRIALVANGITSSHGVHRLVLFAFIGPCPPGLEACHNDGNPANNTPSNLRWDTRKANQSDRINHGTSNRGERHGKSKLTDEVVRRIRDRCAAGETQHDVARDLKISQPMVSNIVSKRNWKHVA